MSSDVNSCFSTHYERGSTARSFLGIGRIIEPIHEPAVFPQWTHRISVFRLLCQSQSISRRRPPREREGHSGSRCGLSHPLGTRLGAFILPIRRLCPIRGTLLIFPALPPGPEARPMRTHHPPGALGCACFSAARTSTPGHTRPLMGASTSADARPAATPSASPLATAAPANGSSGSAAAETKVLGRRVHWTYGKKCRDAVSHRFADKAVRRDRARAGGG